jgi:tetratricopeptide (TPR) repeat protein
VIGARLVSYALKLRPDSPDAHLLRGWFLYERGETAEAVSNVQRALELDPEYSTAWSALGLFLVAVNRPDEAVSAFRETLRVYPGSPQKTMIRLLITDIQNKQAIAGLQQLGG